MAGGIQQKNAPTKSVTFIMEKYDKYHGLDSDTKELRQLKKAVNVTCNAGISMASYSGTPEERSGKNRSLRILGLALHVAGDAYAHKAIVPYNSEVMNKLNAHRVDLFTASTYSQLSEDLQKSVKTNCITMSRLSEENIYAKSGNEKAVHKEYADNTKFCPKRYDYGAQNVVQTLLKQYFEKSATFSITSFYNYGTNKNNIFQYRLDKYALQANGNKNPGGLNWSAYSGNN